MDNKSEKNIEILVVDDEEIMRTLFTDILTDSGYKVTTVSNGDEAQNKIKEKFFPIAFVDFHMPIMDGVKTVKALKSLSPDTAIVMMDSMPSQVKNHLQGKGVIDCIHKPFNIKEVRSIVSAILDKL